jgi:hypothetical protein
MIRVPLRYLPSNLTKKDKKKQVQMLQKSRRFYKKNKYFDRPALASYKNKTSKHILNARKIYGVNKIIPGKELVRATGCTLDTLQKIVHKGEGAYYSSGSRPNQTARSWGIARLASALTAGKSAAVDYSILESGCNHRKKAFLLAKKARQKYHYGHSKTRKVTY